MNHTILISLVDQLTPMLRALAQQLVCDEATAEELVQTTFLALARLPEPPSHPKGTCHFPSGNPGGGFLGLEQFYSAHS